MPASYAHYRFGKLLLSEMPADAPEADEPKPARPDADTAYQGLL